MLVRYRGDTQARYPLKLDKNCKPFGVSDERCIALHRTTPHCTRTALYRGSDCKRSALHFTRTDTRTGRPSDANAVLSFPLPLLVFLFRGVWSIRTQWRAWRTTSCSIRTMRRPGCSSSVSFWNFSTSKSISLFSLAFSPSLLHCLAFLVTIEARAHGTRMSCVHCFILWWYGAAQHARFLQVVVITQLGWSLFYFDFI